MMVRDRLAALIVLAAATPFATAGCAKPSHCCAPGTVPTVSNDLAPMQSPPCNEERVAAKLIVLAVDGLDESASQRIQAALSERYNQGLISTAANPDNDLVTVLARADSDITVTKTVGLLQTFGIEAREGTEQESQAAESALATQTIVLSASAVSADGHGKSHLDAGDSTLCSLSTSLDPLRDRFNRDKGKLRFVAILSPT